MLMYRRREPTVNIDAVPVDFIPQHILTEIAQEQAAAREAALAKEAEEERRRAAVPFAVCHGEQMKILWVKEMLTWEEALRQVHHELSLEGAPESIRLVRLEPAQRLAGPLRESSGSDPVEFDCDSGTLVKDVPHLRAAICQVAVGELPGLVDTAHIHYGELEKSDVSRHLACAVGTPFKTMAAQISDSLQISENEAVQFFNKLQQRVSGLALRKQVGHYRALTAQWMREALTDATGLGAAERLCELVSSQEVRLSLSLSLCLCLSVSLSLAVSLSMTCAVHALDTGRWMRACFQATYFSSTSRNIRSASHRKCSSTLLRLSAQQVTSPLIAHSVDTETYSSLQVQLELAHESTGVSHTGDPRWPAHS